MRDIGNAVADKTYFDRVFCTICHLQAFIFVVLCSMGKMASNVRCENLLRFLDSAICNHPVPKSVLLLGAVEEMIDELGGLIDRLQNIE